MALHVSTPTHVSSGGCGRRGRDPLRISPISLLIAAATLLVACTAPGANDPLLPDDLDPADDSTFCSIPLNEISDGGPGKDGIPALTDPEMVAAGDPGTQYIRGSDRVIGVVLDGQALAVPHRIGWYHEIVNLNYRGRQIAITYCPLTGSSIVFDRSPIGGAELGVSGLLYQTNLIMYDRSTRESLWPQMARGARCGPRTGTQLPTLPAYDMTWAGWLSLHPGARVVA
ncbi:MAG TPA: DUF3179 domain-containing (seleno)protein, partial [Longimicrobiaceae bacterium]|nr:DUF3179 domain-containing (seleno)protein [Longimicrobiaceae bacterium]